MDGPLVTLSKALTSVLRHRAHQMGISIREDGFAKVHEVLAVLRGPWNSIHVAEVVRRSFDAAGKARFELREEDGCGLIRTLERHTMKDVYPGILPVVVLLQTVA